MTPRALALLVLFPAWAGTRSAQAIPAFARKYRTSCSTCHTAAPKLNVLGEAFRLNGYRMPLNERLLRRDEPVALGEEPWRELWPRAIWPGELPGVPPIALRMQLDAYLERSSPGGYVAEFGFPNEVYLLAGGSLGPGVSSFLEAEWERGETPELVQARLGLADPIPGVRPGLVRVEVGLQNLYLFTFADRQIDRAGRLGFRWQTYAPSAVALATAGGQSVVSANDMPVTAPQPAVVVSGLPTPRLRYAVALAQGHADGSTDNNHRKDVAYSIRFKLGGLRLDGTYPDGRGPPPGGHGQLRDRALILEHFGYAGGEPVAGGQDGWHALGVAVRLLAGPVDFGIGHVWRRDARPFGTDAPGFLRQASLFGRLEYGVFPWLIGSLQAERFTVSVAEATRAAGYTAGRYDETRVVPGVVMLIRQNLRFVAEAELFPRHARSAELGVRRPATLALRLDLAY